MYVLQRLHSRTERVLESLGAQQDRLTVENGQISLCLDRLEKR